VPDATPPTAELFADAQATTPVVDHDTAAREAEQPAQPVEAVPAPEPAEHREPPVREGATQPAARTPAVAEPRVELPVVSGELPRDSGLVLVETRHHPAPAADADEAPRGRRARPQRVEVHSEPLEMVETRKDMPSASQ
jgi:hypothetical protein